MTEVRAIRRKIRLLEEEIARDTTLAEGVGAIRYDKDKVQTTPEPDRLTIIIGKIIENKEELEREVCKLQEKERQIREFLLKLPEKYERVLVLHYFESRNWAEVAVIMNYDDRYVYEIKDKALKELDEVLKQTE